MASPRRARRAGIVASLLIASGGVAAADEELPRWEVSAAAASGTPAVLSEGLAVGAMGEVTRQVGTLPLFVSARLSWMMATAANQSWIIDHHQFVGALGVGVARSIGVGRLWAQAGVGGNGLYEVLIRHQHQRIEAAGVPGGEETSFGIGPTAFAELGVGVLLRGRVRGFLAAGPTLARMVTGDGARARLGGTARLGVAYDF